MKLEEKRNLVEGKLAAQGFDIGVIRSQVLTRSGTVRKSDPTIAHTDRDQVAGRMVLRLVRVNVGILRMRHPLANIPIDGGSNISSVMMAQMMSRFPLPIDDLDAMAQLLILEQLEEVQQ